MTHAISPIKSKLDPESNQPYSQQLSSKVKHVREMCHVSHQVDRLARLCTLLKLVSELYGAFDDCGLVVANTCGAERVCPGDALARVFCGIAACDEGWRRGWVTTAVPHKSKEMKDKVSA